MRKLKTMDVFAAARIVKAAGIKEEVKRIALEYTEKKEITENYQRQVGAELVLSIIDGLSEKKAENMMYEFLAGPFEMKCEEIANLELQELFEKIAELGKLESPEGWAVFFKSLGGLIRQN